jgi:lipopolysaccharide export system protein LptA
MRLTIERMRTMVLVAGGLLVVALGVFLVIAKYKNPFIKRDLPKRLGIDIQQEANGFTHAEFRAGHALFKITASKVEELKDQHYRLHTVRIEMYGPDSSSTDSIEGNEFEYDQKTGIATAAGPVEITISRPPKSAKVGATRRAAAGDTQATGTAAQPEAGQIHVKTSGLAFDQHSGVATTQQHVDFALAEGSGSATGATYASQQGHLELDRDVVVNTLRNGEALNLKAQHADVDRSEEVCRLMDATARYHEGELSAREAKIDLREDGTARRIDATGGVTLATANGGHIAAPTGWVVLDAHNQPQHGNFSGGVTLDSDNNGRKVHGTSPTADLEFGAQGVLRRTHLERGVNLAMDQESGAGSSMTETHRVWVSPVADLDFESAGKGQVELARMRGTGGVVVTGESRQGNGPATPSRMSADIVTGVFGENSELTDLDGEGHAKLMETKPSGVRQSTSGDSLIAHLAPSSGGTGAKNGRARNGAGSETQIESAVVTGNVKLEQEPGAQQAGPGQNTQAKPMHATAARAVYEGNGQWLHLTGDPHVESAGLQMTADKVDVAQGSGDAFAHGNVKATWFGDGGSASAGKPAKSGFGLGSDGPAHVISAEAQMHQATGEATFRGAARLWQGPNSVAAPVLVLNRTQQTLVAQTTDGTQPVRLVLVSANGTGGAKQGKSGKPSVIRVRSGDLKYTDADRKAVLHGSLAGSVVAENGEGVTRSDEAELTLLPAGSRNAAGGGAAQVDRMTAKGHVAIDLEGRHGAGEQLVYTGANDEYRLTGSPGHLPHMADPARGDVTGEALIFNSRDDSVNVEGNGTKTLTNTTVPKRP